MSLNPWVALILGILIGWLLEWLLELWFFRRRRLECQRRLTQVEAELQMREAELRDARDQATALEEDLAGLRAASPAPAVDFDRLAPDVTVKLPAAEVEAPDITVTLPEAETPEGGRLEADFDALKGSVVGGLAAAAGLSSGVIGKPGGEGRAEELPAAEEELPAIDFDRLAAHVEAPDVTVKLPAAEVAAPAAEVDWPEIAARVAEVELPAAGGPAIGAELRTGAGLPDEAVEVLAPRVAAGAQVDDLTRIPGIGPKYAAQLAAAGITSFAALSAAQPDQLKSIVAAPEWRRVDYGAWVAGAQVLASQPQAARAGDDLTLLEGIGPVYAAKLNEAGIMTFTDLAAADEARLSSIIQAPAWRRINTADWIAQARLAAAGDQEGLKTLQAALFSRQGDNIGLISGVGEKAARALNDAGITTFGALAAASPDQVAQITRTAGVRGGDFAAWIGEAQARAAGKRIVRAARPRGAKTVSCPQDLSRVKGIGSVYEQKLYAAGIGTFWELAHCEAEELARIFDLKDFQDVDLAALKSGALQLAEETGTTGRSWDGTPPDDFEPLEGIGEVYEGRLYDAGICTYRALADATVEQLADICRAPEWRRPDYASWIAQARRLLGREA